MNHCIFGDCRQSMRHLIADGVRAQMCVTSPPYFGLRDYGHDGQVGLEATPNEYVSHIVEAFDLVRDLLVDDGVLWLNLGDSYAGSWGAQGRQGASGQMANRSVVQARSIAAHPKKITQTGSTKNLGGLKPKDLMGIPWRVAFALQDAGWYLRQDIIWHKPNPMPESVTDRCTKAHEYLFLLSKSERYFFDSEAIAERSVSEKPAGNKTHKYADAYASGNSEELRTKSGLVALAGVKWETRNRRSVWTVPTTPYSGAHFATFPPALIEPCILAGSRPGDIVLDPFFGSGTTGEVAQRLGRNWIGCEINETYEPLQRSRTAQSGLALEVR